MTKIKKDNQKVLNESHRSLSRHSGAAKFSLDNALTENGIRSMFFESNSKKQASSIIEIQTYCTRDRQQLKKEP